jgi:hypothetical protein
MNELLIRKAGLTFESMEDWLLHAPPDGGVAAWQAGQPEYELARAIFSKDAGTRVPDELKALLASNAVLGAVRLTQGIPAYQVRLDGEAGGSQRCDLMGVGTGREGRCAVVVEAWSDGGFGPRIADQLKRGRPGSQWARRIGRLCEAVLGKSAAEAGGLRGGLIHRAAAALRAAEGEKAAVAVLIFHEFRRKDSRGQQRKGNITDIDALVAAVGGQPLKDGVLAGPFRIPGGNEIPASVPLFIGKTVRLLPS